LTDDKVIDIKSSFSGATFPLYEDVISNKTYISQLQSYMILTGRRKAELVYVLGNVNEDVILKEFKYNNKKNLEYDDFRKQYIYDGIDSKYRIKRYEVDYDPDFEAKLKGRVKAAQEFINNNWK
jgi:hypothetical protein